MGYIADGQPSWGLLAKGPARTRAKNAKRAQTQQKQQRDSGGARWLCNDDEAHTT
jgi:hypothetical protein